ncbi:predicted protein [Nematostella vectensis]|uniref:BTB domain-containing protein n=1 Tax=Nematostella vectensis TaxID=45351 RepID=A7SD21_NEMVE|nr:predicted protein [Nematostella vectensis]|eukprot:XP_001630504.1 predicted protein [Nematostella vectensis]
MKPKEEQKATMNSDIYCGEMLQRMNGYRVAHSLCDVDLMVEGLTFSAHRLVLAAGSPFFHGLFTTEMKEKQENKIVLKQVKASVMENVLEYLYTGKTSLNPENAEDLVVSASYFLIEGLKEKASNFIRSSLNVDNCIQVREFAEKHDCKSLSLAARVFIGQHFGEIINGEEFLGLEFEKIEEFIASENTVVPKEERIYEAVTKWVRKAPAIRKKYFKKLFHHVRLSLLSRKFLNVTILQDELVTSNVACMQFVLQSMSNVQSLPPIQKPRKCLDSCVDAVVISGGFDDDNLPTASTICFIPEMNNTWYELTPLSIAKYGSAAAYCDGFLYSVGGWEVQASQGPIEEDVPTTSVERYDPTTNTWLSVAPLKHAEKFVSVISLDGHLYCLGRSKSMYRYTPAKNTWEYITGAPEELHGACVVADASNIYVIGGLDQNNMVTSSCWKYDPEVERWSLLSSMSTKRYLAAGTVKGREIFIVGGLNEYGSTQALNSVEVYYIDTDEWSCGFSYLQFPRYSAGVTCIWDKVLVFGGEHEGETQNSIEWYNKIERRWELCPKMPCRSNFCCNWLRIPKNLLEVVEELEF